MNRKSTTRSTVMVGWAAFALFCLWPRVTAAQQPSRIWVDASGQFSVEATLIRWTDNEVVLLRLDGRELKLPIDLLSQKDKEFVEQSKAKTTITDNVLRTRPPVEPDIKPLATLQLPKARQTADEGSILSRLPATETLAVDSLPASLPADRSPWMLTIPEARIQVQRVDFANQVSRPIPVVTANEAGHRSMSLVVSISDNFRLQNAEIRQQLVRFDLKKAIPRVAYRHDQSIRLFDHHLDSGRSLVLVGFNSLDQGGELAVVDGWNTDDIRLSHRRQLDDSKSFHPTTRLRWARWIDEEHVLAVFDQTIALWNLVSGKQIYRIDQIDSQAEPALSGGRRYLAMPYEGGVDLYSTETGQPLGRIPVEKQTPGVSFSPLGNSLAIVTSKRVRVWNLPAAALEADVKVRRSVGTNQPLWIDSDLILTSSGIVVSLFRGLPIWQYDIAATEMVSTGNRVAIFRKAPMSELSLLTIPHQTAQQMLRRIDSTTSDADRQQWRIPGRSLWDVDGWVDRDLQIGVMSMNRR